MRDIVIVGAGGLGREVLSLIEEINEVKPTFNCLGFLDDNFNKGTLVNCKPILGAINEDTLEEFTGLCFAIGFGNTQLRKDFFYKIKSSGGVLPNIIHPLARIDKHVSTNLSSVNGNIICCNTSIGCNVSLGENNYINIGAVLAHDTMIGSHNTIMQNCVFNGSIVLEDSCFIGPGVVLNGTHKIASEEKIIRS